MRRAVLIVSALVVGLLQVTQAQGPPKPTDVPVRRVVLYKNGIGYFEHVGKVRGNETVTVAFNSSQLNDVLKTLTVLDLGSGRVTGVSYNSEAPFGERLSHLRLPVDEHATLTQLLDALRGARLEVRGSDQPITGRLLSVEQRNRISNGMSTTVAEMTLVSDAGEIRVVEITAGVIVELAERDSTEQVGAYMGLLASQRARDQRLMRIATAGSGERDLFVSYISEVPVWKTTYRIVLPSRGGAPQLQGVGDHRQHGRAKTGRTSSCRSSPVRHNRSCSSFRSRSTPSAPSSRCRSRCSSRRRRIRARSRPGWAASTAR